MRFCHAIAPWRLVICLGIACFLLALGGTPASAQFYVRSPDVDKGETELEEHGAVFSGPGEDERLRQSHEVEAKYGFTDKWEGIVEGFFDQEIGGDLKAQQFELGGQYEIIEREEGDGVGLGFRAIYELGLQDHSPDEIQFGPLAKWVSGRNSAMINTFFVGQVGNNVEIDSLEFQLNWQVKREFTEHLAVGIEGFSEIEDLAHAGSFDEQLHRVGPVVYWELGEKESEEDARSPERAERPEGVEWDLAAGALFGLSDATSDVTFKFDIEAEF
ncbi:hypothetical protein [Methyloceanibacter sp.]|uniref:hypothetical protein n=1 Tax=Methyloceanibacter sp. TaxID=1965321 RepID=UPI002D621D07|nr:hypothetical protein [Methyloceanibacter sp.]HZP10170.1 hypothetical protein [Methyloceanibacter sp.]